MEFNGTKARVSQNASYMVRKKENTSKHQQGAVKSSEVDNKKYKKKANQMR